jgi:glycosyltransferase involved in cell wall biosynthesis
MRVLQIGAKNFPPAHGGTERLVYDLVKGMPGVDSHVLVDLEHDSTDRKVSDLPKGFFSRWRAIRRYAQDNNIDVIHVHKSSNIPLALMLKLLGHRCVMTVHGCIWRRGERRWSLPVKGVFWGLDFLACLVLDNVVLVGEHDWMSFETWFPKRRLLLIRNGVSINATSSTFRQSGWTYLGRISPEKNILRLLKAARDLPEKLVLYGPISPPNRRFEEDFLAELKGSNAEWRGPVPADEVRATLGKYRVFINPSFTEGLPFTVLEAAAEGLNLVLSDIRPHRLLGFPCCSYVDPNELDLRKCLKGLSDSGTANQAHVAARYDVQTTLREYERLYQRIAKQALSASC